MVTKKDISFFQTSGSQGKIHKIMAKPNKMLSPQMKSKLKNTNRSVSSAVAGPPGLTRSCTMFKRREGTSGISGHLFETKLLSLLYFRAFHDKRITKFQLASNVDNMGAFDDICFKVEVEEFDRPVMVFIQAKHRENKKQTLTIDLATYFISYLKVREHFDSSNKELFFKGIFDEAECLFVLYTTARDEFSDDLKVESSTFSIMNDLIGTGGTAKQPYKLYEDVEFLCKVAMKEQMISLAEQLAKFIYDDGNFHVMLADELIQRYHVVLAQKALDVSEIQLGGHRIASFRQDFFDVNEEHLSIFKDTLIRQILKKRKIKPNDVKTLLSEFLTNPSDASILSKLIGTVIPYNNGQLVFDKKITHDFKPDMKPIDVPRSTVNKAVELAAKEILLSPEFKLRVPAAFGNKDITLSGSDEKKKKRIKYLSTKITDLLDNCNSSKIVNIDETLEDGFLQLNGGIAGAIGNIFVLDDDTKLMKVTNNGDSLGSLAKNLYDKLYDEIRLINEKRSNNKTLNLCEYKFNFKVNKFPKLLLECSENEGKARDFFNKLVIYSNQADEEGVEDILKSEIEENQLSQPNYLQVQTDAILSKYHDEMLKWWKRPEQAEILTRESDLFQKVKKHIIKDPLLIILTAMYQNKMKPADYTFTEDAVSSLNLQNQHLNTVIITGNSRLTVVKVIQHFNDKDHVVVDLEYIVKLPPNDRNVLCKELKDLNKGKVLILVCDEMQKGKHKILENIAKVVLDKKTIVVTNHSSVKLLQKYFLNPPIHDEKNSLINMSEESQKRILENSRVMFQDTEVRLDLILDKESKPYIKEDVLIKIISQETIEVGKLIVSRNYNEIKYLHVDRRVRKSGDNVDIVVETLYSIPDNVVLVTAEAGMGKSTLLTHLSIKTKELKPEVWIVRINLLEYSTEFSKWKEESIDQLETIKFICQVILRDKLGKENNVEITLEEKDNVVYLKNCTADSVIQFELNLFLHFYCKRDIILLFDAFDEICPHYTDVVMKFLKCVRSDPFKQRMWITSRSYNEIKYILLDEFGLSYELLYFTKDDMIKYWETCWETNLGLEKLNSTQIENIKKFLGYMAAMVNKQIPYSYAFEEPLFGVFKIAACYFNFKIAKTGNKNYENYSIGELTCDANPLLLYLTALYIVDNIKDKNSTEWYLDVDTYKVYERFLGIKIKRRYQEKNGMNIHNPDIIKAYDKELADSILTHKKLAAYAIFYEFSAKLYSVKELEEIKELIKNLKKGEEKTGLIDYVINGIPIFTHTTFTKYFAFEYVCECLKIECSSERLGVFGIVLNHRQAGPSSFSANYSNAGSIYDYFISMRCCSTRK